jgi:hypothetical protein
MTEKKEPKASPALTRAQRLTAAESENYARASAGHRAPSVEQTEEKEG